MLEVSLWLISPIALVCFLMFLAGVMSAEKYTSVGLLSFFFRRKLLTKKGRFNQIGLWISFLPILILLTFLLLDLPIHEAEDVMRSESPDGSKFLVISKRERFPLDELFDPTLSVRFSLVDKNSNRVLAKRTLHLEISDLKEASSILWERKVVKVQDFDYQNPNRVVTLQHRIDSARSANSGPIVDYP